MAIVNNFTALIPTMYRAMQTVSREMVGMIPSVTIDAKAAEAAKDQVVRTPVMPIADVEDFDPSMTVPDTGTKTADGVDVTINKVKVAPIAITGENEAAVGSSYESMMEQNIAQGIRALVNQVEVDLCYAAYRNASRAFGTAGTTPFGSDLSAAAELKKILDDNGAPGRNDPSVRSLVLNSTAGVNLRKLANLMTSNQAGSDQTLRQGTLLPIVGFGVRESAGIQSHTKGTATGILVNSTTLAIGDKVIPGDTSNSGTVLPGDIITINGDTNKYAVKSATISGAASGNITIGNPGARTVLANDSAITIGNSYTANLGFSRNAISLVARSPKRPSSGDGATDIIVLTDPVSGLSFTFAMYKGYGAVRFQVELAWGVGVMQSEHIAILLG